MPPVYISSFLLLLRGTARWTCKYTGHGRQRSFICNAPLARTCCCRTHAPHAHLPGHVVGHMALASRLGKNAGVAEKARIGSVRFGFLAQVQKGITAAVGLMQDHSCRAEGKSIMKIWVRRFHGASGVRSIPPPPRLLFRCCALGNATCCRRRQQTINITQQIDVIGNTPLVIREVWNKFKLIVTDLEGRNKDNNFGCWNNRYTT